MPHQMTRGQQSRYQREQQRVRRLYYAMAGVTGLIVLLFAIVGVNELLIKPAQLDAKSKTIIATVGSTQISRATYNKRRSWDLFNQIRTQQFYAQQGINLGQGTDSTTQIAQLQQELRTVATTDTLDPTTLQAVADNELLAQQSGSLGVSVNAADIMSSTLKDFAPVPTAIPQSPTPAPSATVTPATPIPTVTPTVTGTPPLPPSRTPTRTNTPGPSPTQTTTPTTTSTPLPVPGAEKTATVNYSVFLQSIKKGPKSEANDPFCGNGCPSLTEQEYLDLVAKPALLQTRVTDELQKKIPTTAEQVHVAHILFMVKSDQNSGGTHTEEAAKKLADDTLARLNKGEDFATLAGQLSEDTSNKDKGGDLGFFLPTEAGGPMVQDFSTAAFKLTKPGELGLVKTQFGWHILKLLERSNQPLNATDVETAKGKAYQTWLDEQKRKIKYLLNGVAPTPIPPTSVPVPTAPPAPPVTNVPITGTNPLTTTGTITK